MTDDLLDVAVRAAHHGAEVLMAYFRDPDLGVRAKGPGLDVVSDADLAAEQAIRDQLLDARPEDGFEGEEGSLIEGSSGLTWLVDPLDSTANFVRGIPLWSVSIAAKDREGDTVAAVVAYPPLGEVISASRSSPLRAVGTMVKRRADASLGDSMVAVGWGRGTSGRRQGAAVEALTAEVGRVRSPGSPALGLAWTAVGRFDAAYYEMDFHPWDVAAGVFLCEKAGLVVVQQPPAVTGGSPRLLAAPGVLYRELSILLRIGRH